MVSDVSSSSSSSGGGGGGVAMTTLAQEQSRPVRFTAPDKLPPTFCFTFLRITILLINVAATYYSVLQGLTFVTCQKGNSLRHHIDQNTSVFYFQHPPTLRVIFSNQTYTSGQRDLSCQFKMQNL